MRCPICKKEVRREDPQYPFCSERCRIIDLGNWASGKYVIPTPLTPQQEKANKEQNEEELDREGE